jgi:hypothetical protein
MSIMKMSKSAEEYERSLDGHPFTGIPPLAPIFWLPGYKSLISISKFRGLAGDRPGRAERFYNFDTFLSNFGVGSIVQVSAGGYNPWLRFVWRRKSSTCNEKADDAGRRPGVR